MYDACQRLHRCQIWLATAVFTGCERSWAGASEDIVYIHPSDVSEEHGYAIIYRVSFISRYTPLHYQS